MKRKALTLMLLICFLIGIVSIMELAAQTKDSKSFKKESEPNVRAKTEMLKTREYRQILKDVKASGRKGLASGQRLRVYPKEASASEVNINEKGRGGPIARTVKVGAVFVDSGGSLGEAPAPVGILMIGEGKNHRGLKLTVEVKDGNPMASLVDAKGKSIHDASIEILEKSHLKVRPNGTAIAVDNDDVLVLLSDRDGKTYALVIPSEVIVELLGPMGSGSLEGKS